LENAGKSFEIYIKTKQIPIDLGLFQKSKERIDEFIALAQKYKLSILEKEKMIETLRKVL
jgi:hypothetical protein